MAKRPLFGHKLSHVMHLTFYGRVLACESTCISSRLRWANIVLCKMIASTRRCL